MTNNKLWLKRLCDHGLVWSIILSDILPAFPPPLSVLCSFSLFCATRKAAGRSSFVKVKEPDYILTVTVVHPTTPDPLVST